MYIIPMYLDKTYSNVRHYNIDLKLSAPVSSVLPVITFNVSLIFKLCIHKILHKIYIKYYLCSMAYFSLLFQIL